MNSCINIGLARVGNPLTFDVNRVGQGMNMSARRIGEPLSFYANRADDMMQFSASRHGEPMSFRCGLVCTVGSKFYLEVPTESIWLLPENDFSQEVVVYANVSWTIE